MSVANPPAYSTSDEKKATLKARELGVYGCGRKISEHMEPEELADAVAEGAGREGAHVRQQRGRKADVRREALLLRDERNPRVAADDQGAQLGAASEGGGDALQAVVVNVEVRQARQVAQGRRQGGEAVACETEGVETGEGGEPLGNGGEAVPCEREEAEGGEGGEGLGERGQEIVLEVDGDYAAGVDGILPELPGNLQQQLVVEVGSQDLQCCVRVWTGNAQEREDSHEPSGIGTPSSSSSRAFLIAWMAWIFSMTRL